MSLPYWHFAHNFRVLKHALETLGKICGVLKVNVGDIVDIFPDAP